MAKRLFDIVFSFGWLVLFAPLMLVVALLVRLKLGSPVLFRQERPGLRGQPFRMVKFRTMVPDAEARLEEVRSLNRISGPAIQLDHDPRVTRSGNVLRKTSIDELPQLWNVLRGEMSLVGPRPALPDEAALWSAELRDRLRVQPGITGMWQVSGRSNTSFDEYSRLDLYYVDNWSLWLDIKIILRTAVLLLRDSSAY